jgi:NitT/TauT family transport system permease protein
MKRLLFASLLLLTTLLLWQLLVSIRVWSPVLLPSPASVLRYLYMSITDGTLLGATLVTMRRLLLGYSIGPRTASGSVNCPV